VNLPEGNPSQENVEGFEAPPEFALTDQPAAQPEPAPAPVAQRNIYRDFKSVDELTRYTQNLEAQLLRQKSDTGPVNKPETNFVPVAPQPAPSQKRLAEMFWEDPNVALETVRSQAVEEALKIVEKRSKEEASRNQFWSDFYTRNPDLRRFDDDVRMTLVKFGQEIEPLLSTPDGAKRLAERTREKLNAVVEWRSKGTQLPSGGAVTMPASPTSPPPKEPEYQVVGFVDQINNLRKRSRTSAG
jgi:hypothetical protein